MLRAGFLDILRATGFEGSGCADNSDIEGEALSRVIVPEAFPSRITRVLGHQVRLASGNSGWTSCDVLRAFKCSNSGHVETFGGC